MARMTPEEATAVNVVCSYLAGLDAPVPAAVVEALATLASRAHNRIQTGWDEVAVRKQWPLIQEGPHGRLRHRLKARAASRVISELRCERQAVAFASVSP